MADTKSGAAGRPVAKGDRVYLVDASGYIFRAYHALPPLTRQSDGLPVGAVHGFCAMLWKLLREKKGEDAATHIAVIFDHSEQDLPQRPLPRIQGASPGVPEDLVPQFPLIRRGHAPSRLPASSMEGFEADDLIATYAARRAAAGGEVTIVSSDKDLMQLVEPGIRHARHHEGQGDRPRTKCARSSACRPKKVIDVQALAATPSTTCPACPASASRPRPS